MLDHKPHILIVDDETTNLFLLEELLICQGYTPLIASSGQEALQIAAKSTPDLILLDVMMPQMDGFEVCRKLRSNSKLQTVPVIFLTALDDEDARLRGLEVMGDDYLTKPINNQLLLTKIANVLRLNQMRTEQSQAEVTRRLKEQSRKQVTAAWRVNEDISEKFRLFVPEQYLCHIAPRGVESIRLGNAREVEMTVLFCDIRGFTAIAESQSAMETFQWLNIFFTRMSQEIASAHGFVDKFLGDALLAIFDRSGHHAEDALLAAVKMRQSLSRFNSDRQQYNLQESINVGIGVHTGVGLIGTVGSDDRMDSTVIGDVVNTAARLEELTKLYACPILASDQTIAQVKTTSSPTQPGEEELTSQSLGTTFYSRWIDRVTPRGKQQSLELYEVLGMSTELIDMAKVKSQSFYHLGIEAWKQGQFGQALGYFQQVAQQNPTDKIAKLYIKRCQVRLPLMPEPAVTSPSKG